MKIKLSKSQWEAIGKKTGWMMKEAWESLHPSLDKDILTLKETVDVFVKKLLAYEGYTMKDVESLDFWVPEYHIIQMLLKKNIV